MWAFVPWVHLGGLGAGALAVIIMTLASIPAQIFSVGIYPLLAEMLPDHHRIHVFAVRAIISACVVSAVTFVSGQWLNRATFPGNYQVIYIVGWACGISAVATVIRDTRPIKAMSEFLNLYMIVSPLVSSTSAKHWKATVRLRTRTSPVFCAFRNRRRKEQGLLPRALNLLGKNPGRVALKS